MKKATKQILSILLVMVLVLGNLAIVQAEDSGAEENQLGSEDTIQPGEDVITEDSEDVFSGDETDSPVDEPDGQALPINETQEPALPLPPILPSMEIVGMNAGVPALGAGGGGLTPGNLIGNNTYSDGTISYDWGVYASTENPSEQILQVGMLTPINFSWDTNIESVPGINIAEVVFLDPIMGMSADAFDFCSTTLRRVEFADGATNIPATAFQNFAALEEVVLPEGLAAIGASAFAGCSSLQSIDFPSSLTTLSTDAFRGCSALTEITLPENLTIVQDGVFYGCTSLGSVTNQNIGRQSSNSVWKKSTDPIVYTGINEVFDINANTHLTFTGYDDADSGGLTFMDEVRVLKYNNGYDGIAMEYTNGCGNEVVWRASDANTLHIEFVGEYETPSFETVTVPDSGDMGNLPISYSVWEHEVTDLQTAYIEGGVRSISEGAFSNEINLHSVYIADSVTRIGSEAFSGAINLDFLSFNTSSNLEEIGNSAFSGCTALGDIRLPSSIVSIGESAFRGCSRFHPDGGLPTSLQSIGRFAFRACVELVDDDDSNYTLGIPSAVKEIDPLAFYECNTVKAFDVDSANTKFVSWLDGLYTKDGDGNPGKLCIYPTGNTSTFYNAAGSVTEIGEYAFSGCTSLEEIILPNGVTTIEGYAFEYTDALIFLPDSLANMESSSFRGSNSTIVANLGSYAGIEGKRQADLDGDGGTPDLKYQQSPANGMFYSVGVVGADVVLNIYDRGFGDYEDLDAKPIELYDNMVWNLDGYSKEDITAIWFGDPERGDLVSIGAGAFEGFTGLATIEIPGAVKNIGNHAFRGCTNLEDFTIDGVPQLETIGASAFASCTKLDVEIPATVEEIGASAFQDCMELAEATGNQMSIPANVSSIGEAAFSGCGGIAEFDIAVGNVSYASVDGILFNAAKTRIHAYPIGKIGNTYQIPNGVVVIGEGAFLHTQPSRIYFPNSVTTVGLDSFDLNTRVYLNGTSTLVEWGKARSNFQISIGDGLFYEIAVNLAGEETVAVSYLGSDFGTGAMYSNLDSASAWDSRLTNVTKVTLGDGVTSIGDNAFVNFPALEEITIPDSCKSIGAGAFKNLENLKGIVISDAITAIGDGAFENCQSITDIEIPKNVASVGEGVFSGCKNLESIRVDEENAFFANGPYDSEVLYNKARTRLVKYPAQKDTGIKYQLPNSVVEIGTKAFDWTNSNDTFIFPDFVTAIASDAFSNSTSIVYANVGSFAQEWATGNSYTNFQMSIGNGLFYELRGEELEIYDAGFGSGAGVGTMYDASAFQLNRNEINGILRVVLEDGVKNIGMSAFAYFENLESIRISESVTDIGVNAFWACYALQGIEISKNVERIGKDAFAICKSLEYINVDEKNKVYSNVGSDGVLYDKACEALLYYPNGKAGAFTVPDSVKEISPIAFGLANKLTEVTIPASVITIGKGAFASCLELSKVEIKTGAAGIMSSIGFLPFMAVAEDFVLTEIPEYAFAGCMKLSSVTLPLGLTWIGGGAFEDCEALEGITLPDSLEIIGKGAFARTALKSIVIPKKVERIEEFTFQGCTALKDIYIYDTVNYIFAERGELNPSSAFYGEYGNGFGGVKGNKTTIHTYYDSYAAWWAKENDAPVVYEAHLGDMRANPPKALYMNLPYEFVLKTRVPDNAGLVFDLSGNLPEGIDFVKGPGSENGLVPGTFYGSPIQPENFAQGELTFDISVAVSADGYPASTFGLGSKAEDFTIALKQTPTNKELVDEINEYKIGKREEDDGSIIYWIEKYNEKTDMYEFIGYFEDVEDVVLYILDKGPDRSNFELFDSLWIDGVKQNRGDTASGHKKYQKEWKNVSKVDGKPYAQYVAEDGSTRVTIMAQTIAELDNGDHTVAAAFRKEGSTDPSTTDENYYEEWNEESAGSGNGGTLSDLDKNNYDIVACNFTVELSHKPTDPEVIDPADPNPNPKPDDGGNKGGDNTGGGNTGGNNQSGGNPVGGNQPTGGAGNGGGTNNNGTGSGNNSATGGSQSNAGQGESGAGSTGFTGLQIGPDGVAYFDWDGSSPMEIRIDISLEEFLELYFNGDLWRLDQNYRVRSGSTIITVPSEQLEQMEAGMHTLTANFVNETVEIPFRLNKPNVDVEATEVEPEAIATPAELVVLKKNGFSMVIVLIIGVVTILGVGGVMVVRARKK